MRISVVHIGTHAPATSINIELRSKAARINELNAATSVVGRKAVAITADGDAIEYPWSACDFQRVIEIIFTPFACERPA